MWDVLLEANPVKCRMPWMVLDLPQCKSYEEVRPFYELMKESSTFTTLVRSKCKHCLRSCLNVRYEPNVLTRTTRDPRTNKGRAEMNFYMATNEFLVIEEVEGYDLTNFLGEIGGQLGLLTGWSLVSIMALLEIMFECARRRGTGKKKKDRKAVDEKRGQAGQERAYPAWTQYHN